MADGVSDDGSSGELLILASPVGHTDATSFKDTMDEEVDIMEQEQKILATIICTPGVKTFIADIVKRMFVILKNLDTDASITSASSLKIKLTKDLLIGKKFSNAFKPVQSIDTKSVKMVFKLSNQTSFQAIKRGHTRLLDFLSAKNM